MKLFFVVFVTLLTLNVKAEVQPFHISMDVGNDIITIGKSDVSLTKKDGIYQMTSRTKANGLFALFNQDELIETTSLKQTNNRFYPIHYQYTNIQQNKTDTASYDFDYSKKQVRQHKVGKTVVIEMREHSYDPNSMILAVVSWLKNNADRYQGKKLTRDFYYHDHYRAWTKKYVIGEEELLNLPYGQVKAVKIYPETTNDDVYSNIWVSIEKGFIPVKIEQIKNDSVELKMELKQIY